MSLKYLTIFFLLTSCALFKRGPDLQNETVDKLLDAVQLVGEGRGRLSLGKNQYVFSFDSLLKENHDWLLAVSIPLQGEEVMVLPNLKQKNFKDAESESFEKRIASEFKKINLNRVLTSEEFLREMRSLIRFNLATKLGLARTCTEQQDQYSCTLEGENFTAIVSDKEFFIIKSLGQGRNVVLEGKNLTESFFSQTNIRLYSNQRDLESKNSSFSLELFWK